MSEPLDPRTPESATDSLREANAPASVSNVESFSETNAHTVIRATPSELEEHDLQAPPKSAIVGVSSRIGPYELVRKLGQGGMGAVYEARHTKLGKTFALKVLPPGFAAHPDAVSRFEREMLAVGALDHPNIVRATNADEWNGTHYLVMEYVEGTDLSALVKSRGKLSVRDACDAIRQAALGLQHAHEHGLVHRDIKPSNLFVTKQGQVKLLDLGLARLEHAEAIGGELTTSGQVLGTPDYMAPEQWDDTHSADARADLYSLGCTLFFVLTGKAPFAEEGAKPSVVRLMRAHIDGAIPDLLAARPDVPAELNAVYRRLLAKNPEDRFQSAGEVAEALEPFTKKHDAQASGVPADAAERSRHAPRDEPNAPSTPDSKPIADSKPTSLSPTQSFAPSTSERPSTPTERSAHHAARDGDVDAPGLPTTSILAPKASSRRPSTTRQRVIIAASLLACVVIAVLLSRGTRPTTDEANNSNTNSPLAPSGRGAGGEGQSATGWHGWPADAPKPAIAPFNADEAQQHQEAWAKYLNVPVEYENSIGMKFRLIPPGEFMMGSTPQEIEEALKEGGQTQRWQEYIKSEAPQHKVILTRPFYLGIHEVTQAQYEKVIGKNPSLFAKTGRDKQSVEKVEGMDTTSHPVEEVGWIDAAEFCAKLSQLEQFKPFYFRFKGEVKPLDGTGYRLPTEAEWEFSCRAGTTGKFWSGDQSVDLAQVGWFVGNSGSRTYAVGELKANPYGLYDIHGNAWEWVQDEWAPTYKVQSPEKSVINPSSAFSADSQHIVRGGGSLVTAVFCRSSDRYVPVKPPTCIGIRVALLVDAVRQALKVTGPEMPNSPKASVTDAATSSTGKPLTPLPTLDLDETDPLPEWELPAGAPPPVVAPCEPPQATQRQKLWAEFLKRPVIEELDVATLAKTGAVPRPLGSGPDRQTDRPLPNGRGTVDSPSTLKFALIPPGEFRKIFTRPRDPAIEPDMPVRRFRITKPYAISTTEVTWDQFRQFVEATGYQTEAETNGIGGRDREFKQDPKITWRTPGWKPDPNEPVTQVTPRDAEAFCAWLTDPTVGRFSKPSIPDAPDKKDDEEKDKNKEKKDGLENRPTVVYRLPTEAEWLHACRAGSVHKHVVGPDPKDLDYFAWTKGSPKANNTGTALHPVGLMKPNPFGLHDTLGNVWERTVDLLNGPASLSPYLSTNDPRGMPSENLAGASYLDVPSTIHPDFVMSSSPQPGPHVGFRVLKQLDDEPLQGSLDRPLVLRPGEPLSVRALVPRPEAIPGLRSWSIELAGPHTYTLDAIAVNPQGNLIASSGNFGKISLWDRDGNYQRALLGHEGVLSSLDFSPDGRWLASCDLVRGERGVECSTARVWNVETGALHSVIPLAGWGSRVKFSPNGEQLAVSFTGHAYLIVDRATGRSRTPSKAASVGGVAWSPDGSELACVHGDNRLRVWDARTLQVRREVECPSSYSLEWSHDGRWLAHLTAELVVAIRDAQTLAVTKTFGPKSVSNSHSLTWLPDSKRLAVAVDGSSNAVFDIHSGEPVTKFDRFSNAIAVFDEGRQAVFENLGRLWFYDTVTGQKLREGKERGAGNAYSTLSSHGREVFALASGKLWVNDAATGKRLRSSPQSVAMFSLPYPSPDGTLLGIAQQEPTMQVVDPQTGAKRHELLHGQGKDTHMAWSPDEKWLATGATDKLVRVWNVGTGKIERELAGHTGTIRSLAWSPDGTHLASIADDKTVRLWNVSPPASTTRERVAALSSNTTRAPEANEEPTTRLRVVLAATYDKFPEEMSLSGEKLQYFAWTSDSRRLWIALDRNIVPLDIETGTFGPMENFSNGNGVSFLNTSPDGQRLLTRERYGWTFVRGRDAQDRRLLGQHLGHTAQWHPDSRRFLGWAGRYGTVGFDVETNRRLGMLFPWLTGDHWLCLGPTGHYRGSPGVEEQFVYVALHEDGSQRTYTPAEFTTKFNWKNDPEKAELLGK